MAVIDLIYYCKCTWMGYVCCWILSRHDFQLESMKQSPQHHIVRQFIIWCVPRCHGYTIFLRSSDAVQMRHCHVSIWLDEKRKRERYRRKTGWADQRHIAPLNAGKLSLKAEPYLLYLLQLVTRPAFLDTETHAHVCELFRITHITVLIAHSMWTSSSSL